MRYLNIHTCPVYEDRVTGARVIGIDDAEHGDLVSWINVMFLEMFGEMRMLVIAPDWD
jgi:hypothetical protein